MSVVWKLEKAGGKNNDTGSINPEQSAVSTVTTSKISCAHANSRTGKIQIAALRKVLCKCIVSAHTAAHHVDESL